MCDFCSLVALLGRMRQRALSDLARTRDPRHDLACMRNRLGSTDFEEQVSVAARMRVWAHVELD